jgi:hypothetical protein
MSGRHLAHLSDGNLNKEETSEVREEVRIVASHAVLGVHTGSSGGNPERTDWGVCDSGVTLIYTGGTSTNMLNRDDRPSAGRVVVIHASSAR